MNKLFFILLFFLSVNSFAQGLNYKKVDSISYNLYQNAQWEDLIFFGEDAALAGFDYYYFNVRMGVAYYNLKQYFLAEKAFKKAISKNSTADFPKRYLFSTYFLLGERALAEQVYDQLSDAAKKEIKYKKNFLEFVYIEGGAKVPTSNLIGNLYYGNVAFGHRLGNKISVSHSFNMYSQETIQAASEQTLVHRQYDLRAAYFVKNQVINLSLTLASNELKRTEFGDDFTTFGNIKSPINGASASYRLRLGRLYVGAGLDYISQKSQINSELLLTNHENSTLTDSVSERRSTLVPSLSLVYTPNIFQNKITIGVENYLVLTNDNQTFFTFKPSLNVYLTSKMVFSADYISIGNYLFNDKSSNILFSFPSMTDKRLRTTLTYWWTPKINTALTYTFDKIQDSFNNINYNFNSIFLGINYKF